ncbi:MAG TPA: N-acetylglucosamine-6-phosphate deacetylase [Candidatus Limiplasma sp.]|nr:N-acetylglucosamine-6-phosphate deacetylase [Candidatus Limiplasma sp.]
MKAIVNGQVHQGDHFAQGQALLFDEHILGLADHVPEGVPQIDARGGFVSAGLIDVHCHGFGGREAGDVGAEELAEMSRELSHYGVTAWLPTVSCLQWDRYEGCFADIGQAKSITSAQGFMGAQVLGAHAEGPFLNAQKCGAQNPDYILVPDWARAEKVLRHVRLMTVAPEGKDADDLIRHLTAAGITVSIGHTNANYAQAVAGIEAGATHATHTFNAMPSLLHRQPGALGALLNDSRVYCELIADGFHVHPSLIALAARLKGDRLVLITDSIRFAGLPDGEYTIAGQTVTVKGIECRLPDGTIAGSTLTLDRAVRNARDLGGLTLAQALTAATESAAASIGEVGRGALRPGFAADIAIFDTDMMPQSTWVAGAEVWRR